jgi:hypothetical protein
MLALDRDFSVRVSVNLTPTFWSAKRNSTGSRVFTKEHRLMRYESIGSQLVKSGIRNYLCAQSFFGGGHL